MAIGHVPSAAPVSAVAGESTVDAGSVQRAMESPVDLQLRDATIPQVVEQLSRRASVEVRVSDATYALLPWGRQTTLPLVEVENGSLRSALEVISRKLGLEFGVLSDGRAVELRPSPALARLGRPSTLDELRTLDILHGTALHPDRVGRTTLQGTLDAVTAALVEVDRRVSDAGQAAPTIGIDYRLNDSAAGDRSVMLSRRTTAAGALEAISRQTPFTWYPQGRDIVIVPKSERMLHRLSVPLDLRYEGTPIGQVLADLSRRTGVPFRIAPGSLSRISAEAREVRLVLENAAARQALESLSGVTGLEWTVDDEGVYLWTGAAPAQQPTNGVLGGRDRVVAFVRGGDGVDVLVYESELPDDLRTRIDGIKQDAFDAIRRIPVDAHGDRAPEPSSSVRMPEF